MDAASETHGIIGQTFTFAQLVGITPDGDRLGAIKEQPLRSGAKAVLI